MKTWQQHGSMAPNKIISIDNFPLSSTFSIVRHWFVSELIEWLYVEKLIRKMLIVRCIESWNKKSDHFHLPTGVRNAIESLGEKWEKVCKVKSTVKWTKKVWFNFHATPKEKETRPLVVINVTKFIKETPSLTFNCPLCNLYHCSSFKT